MPKIFNISAKEFRNGYLAFQQRERREAMYKTATFLVEHFWGKPPEMADSLGVLLLTWNQAFYRYGRFDFAKLEDCISNNYDLLNGYRKRSILSYLQSEDTQITKLFEQMLDALQICEGSKTGAQSPVAVAKAIHLLAPDFFPLWDDKIARAYDCRYGSNPANKYLSFCQKMKQIVGELQPEIESQEGGKTILKLIDEYNYAKYTKEWI